MGIDSLTETGAIAEISIEKALVKHAEKIKNIMWNSIDEQIGKERGYTRTQADGLKEISSEWVKDRMEKNDVQMYVAIIDCNVVGMVGLWTEHDGKNQITSCYVDPPYRRKGIGKRLMDYAEDFFEKGDECACIAFKTKEGRNFLKKRGYEEVGKPIYPPAFPQGISLQKMEKTK